jgi:hypothetical protein
MHLVQEQLGFGIHGALATSEPGEMGMRRWKWWWRWWWWGLAIQRLKPNRTSRCLGI